MVLHNFAGGGDQADRSTNFAEHKLFGGVYGLAPKWFIPFSLKLGRIKTICCGGCSKDNLPPPPMGLTHPIQHSTSSPKNPLKLAETAEKIVARPSASPDWPWVHFLRPKGVQPKLTQNPCQWHLGKWNYGNKPPQLLAPCHPFPQAPLGQPTKLSLDHRGVL